MTIVLAGATGALGGRIADALRHRDAAVIALVRPGTASDRLSGLTARGVRVVEADSRDESALTEACRGADCVVSALSGLRDTIVSAQGRLLDAAVRAGVKRFIPSDFAADLTRLAPGRNRNFDLRRDFHHRLDAAAIRATSILNGGFTELLTGPAPIILRPIRRVLFWSDPDQTLDFTTMDDTARFTAAAALDGSAPRFPRIAGDQVTARGLASTMAAITGRPWSPRPGRDVPALARHAVPAQHVQRRGEARAARQRPLSGALDQRARGSRGLESTRRLRGTKGKGPHERKARLHRALLRPGGSKGRLPLGGSRAEPWPSSRLIRTCQTS